VYIAKFGNFVFADGTQKFGKNNQKKNSQPTTFSYIKLLGRPLNSGLPIHFVPGYFPQQLSTKSIILNNKKGNMHA
jgi:hypothetical protein